MEAYADDHIEYLYSNPLDPEEIQKAGSWSIFPIRYSRYEHICAQAAIDLRADWIAAHGDSLVTDLQGCNAPPDRHHIVSLSIPECIPERLYLITYMVEYAFDRDDVTEYYFGDDDTLTKITDKIQADLAIRDSTAEMLKMKNRKDQFEANLALKLLTTDRVRGIALLENWSKNIAAVSTFPPTADTFEEYCKTRLYGVGMITFQEMGCYGMNICLTQTEKDLVWEDIVLPAILSTALANDLYSWPKELRAHRDMGRTGDPHNAIPVLMRQYQICEEEAMILLQKKAIEIQKAHYDGVRRFEQKGPVSQDYYKYFFHARMGCSGSEHWSTYSTRYPSKGILDQAEFIVCEANHVLRREYYYTLASPEEVETARKYRPLKEPEYNTARYPQYVELIKSIVSQSTEERMRKSLLETKASSTFMENAPKVGDRDLSSPKETTIDCQNSKKPAQQLISHSEAPAVVQVISPPSSTVVAQATDMSWNLTDEIVNAPFTYLNSQPSKGVRNKFVDALQTWLNVSADSLESIKSIASMLHTSSLMLDDIEDHSTLRRGKAAAHVIYGQSQTINAANYVYVRAVAELQNLRSASAMPIFLEETRNLHLGQSYDLYWRYHTECPTIAQYNAMVDAKTGSLFRLISRLMLAEATAPAAESLPGLSKFVTLLGRYFQVRDDYQNLSSSEYTRQKGHCEDLDEGKFSFPIVHCLINAPQACPEIRGVLRYKSLAGLETEVKEYVLEKLHNTGSMEQTRKLLLEMEKDLETELDALERNLEVPNPILHLLLVRLQI